MRARAVLLAPLALLAGACAGIGHEKVAGWPALRVFEHYVPGHEIRERCAQYVAYGKTPLACAEFRFEAGRCDIWYSADAPLARRVIEHERAHCQGYDHPGETTLLERLQQHIARRMGASSPYSQRDE